MYSLELLMVDWKIVRNMQSVIPKQNKFDTHLVGFTIEMIFIRVLGIFRCFLVVLLFFFEEYCLKCL